VLDCGLLLACAALLRLTPSLCLQVHYSCMLGVGIVSCVAVSVSARSTWSERRRNCAHHFGQLSCRATIAQSAIVARSSLFSHQHYSLLYHVSKFSHFCICDTPLNCYYFTHQSQPFAHLMPFRRITKFTI